MDQSIELFQIYYNNVSNKIDIILSRNLLDEKSKKHIKQLILSGNNDIVYKNIIKYSLIHSSDKITLNNLHNDIKNINFTC